MARGPCRLSNGDVVDLRASLPYTPPEGPDMLYERLDRIIQPPLTCEVCLSSMKLSQTGSIIVRVDWGRVSADLF